MSEPTIFLTEEEAEEIMWGKNPTYYDGDEHRWWRERYYVFERDGKFYEFLYMNPATEDQDGQDVWEAEPIPCYEVTKVLVATYEYRRV